MKPVIRDSLIILSAVFVWKLATIAAAFAAVPLIALQYPMTAFRDLSFTDFGLGLPYWVKIWGNFDGFYYLEISKNGYVPGLVPFFPLYPLLIYVVRELFGIRRIIVGQLISISALIGALFIAIRLFRQDFKATAANAILFLTVILTFPTAFFYTAIYNDSLFFLLATATLLLARNKKWLLASLIGGLASLTRLNGLALFPFLLFEYMTTADTLTQSWNWQRLKKHTMDIVKSGTAWRIPPLFLLVPLAFAAYLTYIYIVFGNWKILFIAMKPWGQERMILPPQVIWRYLKIFFLSFQPHTFVWWVAIWEFAAVALYVFLLTRTYRKIRLSYWIFFAISILIPWLTGTFQGMPRYGLHVYPMYLALYLWVRTMNVRQRVLYFVIALLVSFLALTLFTRGIFVA